MLDVEIIIPQMGEGLQEARLIRLLKRPGERVEKDEPIFEMETDKASMEIEAPASGVVGEWLAEEDEVLAVGSVIGRIRSCAPGEAQAQPEPAAGDGRPPDALRNTTVPPRTRAYAREKGLSDAELARLAEATPGKLLPDAVDRYLADRSQPSTQESRPKPGVRAPREDYEDVVLPKRQRTLAYRLQSGLGSVVPTTMEMQVGWSAIEDVRNHFREASGDEQHRPTQFLLFAWCVAQASVRHPRFRSALVNDTTLRQYAHMHLGIAVARPDDLLLMARLENADARSFEEFVEAAWQVIENAREGDDQATEAMQISLTNLAGMSVRSGIPVVAAPAVATLFIGAPYDEAYPLPGGGVGFRRMANMVLTFDHRLVNGAGAARFLADIRARAEGLRGEFGLA